MIKEDGVVKNMILNFKFDEMIQHFKLKGDLMNLNVLLVMQAVIVQSEVEFNAAHSQLTKTLEKANQRRYEAIRNIYHCQDDHFLEKSLQLTDDPRLLVPSETVISLDDRLINEYFDLRVAELSAAKCRLLQIFMKSVMVGHRMSVFSDLMMAKELGEFRKSFMTIYHANDRFKSLPPESKLANDSQYHHSLLISWGLCNLIIQLLPAGLQIILGTSGFTLDGLNDCINFIEDSILPEDDESECADLILGRIVLIIFYTEIGDNWERALTLINDFAPKSSVFYQYFSAKVSIAQGNRDLTSTGLLDSFKKIRMESSSGPTKMLAYWQMIQVLAVNQRWPEAIQYVKSCSNLGYPSKIFSAYLEAVFTQASTGQAVGALSTQVEGLLNDVLKLSRLKHQAPRPLLDRMAVTRARNVIERGEQFYLPQFEILLLWDRLHSITYKDSVMNQVRKSLSQLSQPLTIEQQVLGWLILAVLSESSEDAVELIFNHIFPKERALQKPNFLSIRAHYELIQRRKSMDKSSAFDVKGELERIEMACLDRNGFPGQSTMQVLISKLKIKSAYQ